MSGGERMLDAAIIGGGPAGLSAGLWLGRYRRRARIYDGDAPRNEPAWAVHGYPGLDDLPPESLRERLREQAVSAGAERAAGRVVEVSGEKGRFRLRLADGGEATASRLLLAYGLRDKVPDVPGLEEAYGRSVFHCPDCDGPSVTGLRVGVLGWDRSAAALALALLTWVDGPVLLAHGREPELNAAASAALESNGVAIERARVQRLVSEQGRLTRVELEDAEPVTLDAVFFHLGVTPACDLAERLGCESDEAGRLRTDRSGETTVPGVYAAGDLTGPPYLTITAAADGVRAALSIHRSLLPAEYELSG